MFILRYSFIQDQDPTILAFLPMTKAAYKGMDAVSDFCVDKGHPKIEKSSNISLIIWGLIFQAKKPRKTGVKWCEINGGNLL